MVNQNLCPKCGAVMDLSNIFATGKAKCSCGYEGIPINESEYLDPTKKTESTYPEPEVSDSEYAKKALKKSERPKEEKDPLNIKDLIGKLAVIFVGVLAMSLSIPELYSVIPVSALGILIFGAGYKIL
jgi:hypothetical protein